MDKLKNLNALIAVVEHHGFAAAARHLGQSRSSINKSVIALEDELGVQLFNRTTRKVSATPSGEAYYERAKRIIADIEDADRAVAENNDEPRGVLRLNAPMSFGALHLGKAISDFLGRYPELRVELSLNDQFTDPVDGGFDATIRIGELDQHLSLVDHPIVEIKRYFMASPAFLEKHGPVSSPDQLKSLPCLHYGSLGEGHTWQIFGQGAEHTIQVNGVMCANNGETLCEAAISGLGIALLPTFIAGPALQNGSLVRVLADYAPPTIHLMLLYPVNRHLSPKIKRLLTFLYERFGDRPVWDMIE